MKADKLVKIESEALRRYVSGTYTRSDFLLIRERIGKEVLDRELKLLMQEQWEEFGSAGLPDEDIDDILHKIHHQIHLEENRKYRKVDLWGIFRNVAAIIILPLALSILGYLIWQSGESIISEGYAEIYCPPGVRTKFQLPDGTSGFLNSSSLLRYPVDFTKSRQVTLVGEAYFEVVKDQETPFLVQTENLYINVLGTAFNVVAYPGESIEEVILQNGSLKITGHNLSKPLVLSPNQKLTFNYETGSESVSNVVASQYTSWTQGKLEFRNEDMEQLAKRLGRWYNTDIVIADNQLYQYTFHATFHDEPLDEVLKLLQLTTPFLYEEEKRELLADGQYSKRKIILRINPDNLNHFK